jgi:hypothetical protein
MLKRSFFISTLIIPLFLIKPVYSLDNNLTHEKVLKTLINGKYDKKNNLINHNLPKNIIKKFQLENVSHFQTNIIFDKEFKQDGKTKHIFVTQTRDETSYCHVCAPIIGVSVLEKNNLTWNIKDKYNYVDRIGTWGQAPIPEFKEIGKNNFGLIFYSDYTGMGITSGATSIIGKVNNSYKLLHSQNDTYENNGGTCGKELNINCYSYQAELSFIKNNDKFYPITFTYKGTKLDDNYKVIKYNLIQKYTFSKDKYI